MNLSGSSLFLLGAAIIYGVTGTLNMAELSARLSGSAVENRHLVYTGAAILSLAFLVKAGAWPLNFWLSPAYSSATPPVEALFAILTEVGVYALIRLWTLMFAGGPFAGFGADAVLAFGVVTVLLASMRRARLAIGFRPGVLGGGRFRGNAPLRTGDARPARARERAVLSRPLHHRLRRAVPPRRRGPALARGRHGGGRGSLPQRGAGERGPQSRRRRRAARDAPLSRIDRAVGTGIPRLRPASRRPSTPAHFPGKGRNAVRVHRLARRGQRLRRANVDLRRGVARLGVFGPARVDAHGDSHLLDGGRAAREASRPRIGRVPLVALLGLTAALVVAAGPAMEFANEAARSLFDRTSYIEAVLGARVRPLHPGRRHEAAAPFSAALGGAARPLDPADGVGQREYAGARRRAGDLLARRDGEPQARSRPRPQALW